MLDKELRQIWIRNAILFGIALIIKLLSLNSYWVEYYYSTNWYGRISHVLRIISSNIPFSIGDILYTWWVIWVLVICFDVIRALIRKTLTKRNFFLESSYNIKHLLRLYIIFNLFWGLNYDREGIAAQLQLAPGHYSTEELQSITQDLLHKANDARKKMGKNFQYPANKEMFEQAADAYDNVSSAYPFLNYRRPSVKRSLYSKLLTYMGYTGYYNPFTGEAQVNVIAPKFYLPFVTCHEIAHQVGYGDESEANFVGYLAASASTENSVQYSAYIDLFTYANGELFVRDSAAARVNYKSLDTLVRKDLQEAREFYRQYKNPVEPVIRFFYGAYLKANHQPHGIDTYDEVTGWLIAYKKKYGKI
ncbi:MAG: DUF3810 domain-containing protein [Filimonas sp.]|nr:DUF3810 domain-containing protein [Filimonas sp.]